MPKLTSPGTYRVRITEPQTGSWVGESSGGTPYVALFGHVVAGPHEGETIGAFLYMSPRTIDRTVKTLTECFDFDGDIYALDDGTAPFVGREVMMVVEEEEYNNETRLKAKWVNPIKSGGGTRRFDLSSIAERTRQIAAQTRKDMGLGEAKPAPARAMETNATEDDLPF